MTHAKKYKLIKISLNQQQQEDTWAKMLNRIYSNEADGHEILIWTHLTSFYSNHLVIFSNLITSKGNLMHLNSYDNRMNWLQRTALDIY